MKPSFLSLVAIIVLAVSTQGVHAAPDSVNPVIELKGSEIVSITLGSVYTDQGVIATDDVDGDITSKVTTKNKVKTNKLGTYIITYNVSDFAGNEAVQVERAITVMPKVLVELEEPEILEEEVIEKEIVEVVQEEEVIEKEIVEVVQEEEQTQEPVDPVETVQADVVDVIPEQEVVLEVAQDADLSQQDITQEQTQEVVQDTGVTQEVTPIMEAPEPTNLVTTTSEGDYTLVTTIPSSLKQGEVATIEITLTNNSGPQEFVFYTFLSRVPAAASADDEGVFITDKFFEGQTLAAGESKTYSFPWLNDEADGSYKLFGEVKSANWSKTLQKNQIGQVNVSRVNPQSLGQSLHRFYSKKFRGHFYTTSEIEKQNVIDNDSNWIYEGIGHKTVNTSNLSPASVQALGIKPVYRFWSEKYKHHFYTVSEAEKQATIADPNWTYEAIAYYTYTSRQMDTIEVFRFYSPVFKGHFYTTSSDERDAIIQNDSNWTYEGIAWYAQR